MKLISKTFLKGLAALLPIAVTIWAVWWIGSTAEKALGPLIKLALPEGWYVPGMGVAAGLILAFVVGVLLNLWIAALFYDWFEKLLEKLPGVKTVYGSVKDLLGFFVADDSKKANQTVVVRFQEGDRETRLLGFITRETWDDLPEGIAGTSGGESMVAVYLPMSYQIGGFTIMVPRVSVTPVDMTTEEALRFAVTAGMTTKKEEK